MSLTNNSYDGWVVYGYNCDHVMPADSLVLFIAVFSVVLSEVHWMSYHTGLTGILKTGQAIFVTVMIAN